jgi:hypothetical protein
MLDSNAQETIIAATSIEKNRLSLTEASKMISRGREGQRIP